MAVKKGLRVLVPFLALTYAVVFWRSGEKGGRASGAIGFASSQGCFGAPVSS